MLEMQEKIRKGTGQEKFINLNSSMSYHGG